MSSIYGEAHRGLQDKFETRRLADRLEALTVKDFMDEQDQGFVSTRDMFFLSTVDQHGRPTVSYKGGDPGFIKVIDDRTIAFPCYDGNGMYLSMGNLSANPEVGILFIDFEVRHRMRLQGRASIQAQDPLVEAYHEAQFVVRVAISQTWVNCPRYIHRYKKLDPSRYVPRQDCDTPLAEWKRIDAIHDALPPSDDGRVEKAGGVLTMDEYYEKAAKGEA
jgi:predicted pyridoxine 5'-phosphate oxidase superfamily flavin-nucleotide-binding protein